MLYSGNLVIAGTFLGTSPREKTILYAASTIIADIVIGDTILSPAKLGIVRLAIFPVALREFYMLRKTSNIFGVSLLINNGIRRIDYT